MAPISPPHFLHLVTLDVCIAPMFLADSIEDTTYDSDAPHTLFADEHGIELIALP